jgi:hypothetical protein
MPYTIKAQFEPWSGSVKSFVDAMQTQCYDDGGMAGRFQVLDITDGTVNVEFTREVEDDFDVLQGKPSENAFWLKRFRQQFMDELGDCELPAPCVGVDTPEFDTQTAVDLAADLFVAVAERRRRSGLQLPAVAIAKPLRDILLAFRELGILREVEHKTDDLDPLYMAMTLDAIGQVTEK